MRAEEFEKIHFSFEDLEVWQKAVDFAEKVIIIADSMGLPRKHYKLLEQMESSSTSVSLNIAEGKGRFSKREFVQYLYIARGSLFETVTLLIIFERRKWISESQLQELKGMSNQIGKMLSRLITSIKKSFSPNT
jgi:four helix bundle protein